MTVNLGLSQVAGNQTSKFITINDATGGIDAAMTNPLAVAVTSTNTVTLTASQFTGSFFFTIDEDGVDPADAAITINVPVPSRGLFQITNATAFDVTVTIASQPIAAPIVATGDTILMTSDGVNVKQAGGGGGGGGVTPYDIDAQFSNTPITLQVFRTVPVVRAITIPADFVNSFGDINTNPTASFVIDVTDDGTTIGTITVSTGGVVTFATVGNVAIDVVAGSILRFIAPAVVDATAADLILGIAGSVT